MIANHRYAINRIKRSGKPPVFSRGNYDIFTGFEKNGTHAIVYYPRGRDHRSREILGMFNSSPDTFEAAVFLIEALHKSDVLWTGLCAAFRPGFTVGTKQDSFNYMVRRFSD